MVQSDRISSLALVHEFLFSNVHCPPKLKKYQPLFFFFKKLFLKEEEKLCRNYWKSVVAIRLGLKCCSKGGGRFRA
uniref:Uncharacterized protein n=1 Tax=Salix viminalis TaxID=40686 RepID=A0A6N2M7M3_SALVM